MTDTRFGQVKRRLELYQAEVGSWKADHNDAMRCMDLELLVAHGLDIFHAIGLVEKALRKQEVLKEMDLADEEAEQLLDYLFHKWMESTEVVFAELDYVEGRGYDVEKASEYRYACHQVEMRKVKKAMPSRDKLEAYVDRNPPQKPWWDEPSPFNDEG